LRSVNVSTAELKDSSKYVQYTEYDFNIKKIIFLIMLPFLFPLYGISNGDFGKVYEYCGVPRHSDRNSVIFALLFVCIALINTAQLVTLYYNITKIPKEILALTKSDILKGPVLYALLAVLQSFINNIFLFLPVGLGAYESYEARQLLTYTFPLFYCILYWIQKEHLTVSIHVINNSIYLYLTFYIYYICM
jgi:hypothetical protein